MPRREDATIKLAGIQLAEAPDGQPMRLAGIGDVQVPAASAGAPEDTSTRYDAGGVSSSAASRFCPSMPLIG